MKNKTNHTPADTAAHAAALTDLGLSPDALAGRQAELLALLRQTVPEVLSDNQIDLVKLKDLLGQERIADPQEHYEMNWAGKTAARREIQKTSSHTLRPDPNNPVKAQHMLIEGENLEVLRVLQKSYYGKVKMIYIDPPYNTGNDSFVYPDNYSETLDEYQRRTGEKNEAGYLNKQSLWKKNSKESGQYHSAWLSMMYPRLYLARNLLRDDGVIFISIDDNEAANLKLLCDEIFGAQNFIAQIIWHNSSRQDPHVAIEHEYLLVYAKTSATKNHGWTKTREIAVALTEHVNQLKNQGKPISEAEKWLSTEINNYQEEDIQRGSKDYSWLGNYKNIDENWNIYYAVDLTGEGAGPPRIFNGKEIPAPAGRHWMGQEYIDELVADDRIVWRADRAYRKLYVSESHENLKSLIRLPTRNGSEFLKQLLGKDIFTKPKPHNLVKKFIYYVTSDSDLILDFFAGSGTTSHAVMDLNADDGGNRQSITVQMPEVLDEDSEAYKAGYRTIADITRARIDKVIAKLQAEQPDKTADLACAYFTLAPSNFKVWRGDANTPEALREQLQLFQSAEKQATATQDEPTQIAMLAELLLKHGLGALGVHAISKPKQVAGITVHRVLMPNDQDMWLCFEPYTEALKTEITKAKPAKVVMLNSCFVGPKADELLSNLQLELAGLEIGLTVI
jgi:adenine-specific DNA-methyltransferase